MTSKFISYQESGVNIDANDEMVGEIYSSVKSTYGPRVIAAKNGFAGLFRLDYDEKLFKKNYKNPVLVACTDGVGSKVQLAGMADRYDTLGIDLVAMSVNDMLVTGAEPLFFLDYLAVNKLDPARVAQLVQGIAAGCKMADCALIGGETAEMPDTYAKDDFDMAGFAVGVVERDKTIDGDRVREGDVILGLASSGLHSNGYTLARRICFQRNAYRMTDQPKGLAGATVGDVLLEPTRIYVRSVLKLLGRYRVKRVVHAMAHITGGGLVGNLPRGQRVGEGALGKRHDHLDRHLDGHLTALLDHVVPAPSGRVGQKFRIAVVESREEAHVVRVVGHDQEVERPRELHPQTGRRRDLFTTSEDVGVLGREPGTEGAGIHRERRVQVGIAPVHPGREVSSGVGRKMFLRKEGAFQRIGRGHRILCVQYRSHHGVYHE